MAGFAWLFMAIGCLSKKQSTSSVKIDSTSTRSAVIKTKNVIDSTVTTPQVVIKTVIINPCDSNGKLKPINQSVSAGQGKASVKTQHDTLMIDCDCDATIQRYRKEIEIKDSTLAILKGRYETDTKQSVIEVTPSWCWKLIAFLLLVIIILGVVVVIIINHKNIYE